MVGLNRRNRVRPEPARSCPCRSLEGRLLLSQQSWAAFGNAGKMEHVVLEESRGTTSANLAGLALTGRAHGAPPTPPLLASHSPHPRTSHLLSAPRSVRHIPPTRPVSSFNWLKRSILHAHSAGGETEAWRNGGMGAGSRAGLRNLRVDYREAKCQSGLRSSPIGSQLLRVCAGFQGP